MLNHHSWNKLYFVFVNKLGNSLLLGRFFVSLEFTWVWLPRLTAFFLPEVPHSTTNNLTRRMFSHTSLQGSWKRGLTYCSSTKPVFPLSLHSHTPYHFQAFANFMSLASLNPNPWIWGGRYKVVLIMAAQNKHLRQRLCSCLEPFSSFNPRILRGFIL